MALLQISEPGASPNPHERRIAVGIDLGTTHSLVAAVRHGVAECLPDEQGRVILPSAVRYLPDEGREIGHSALLAQAEDPENTIVSVKRFMGRAVADIANRDKLPYRFEDSAGMLSLNTRHGIVSPVQVSAEILATLRFPRRRQLCGRRVRRRHHRSGLFRRRAKAGHEGRRATGRPQRPAPDQRADRRGDRLRTGTTPARGSTPSTTWAAAPSTSRCCA